MNTESIKLTVSRFHDRPHPDMANQVARHNQGFRDDSLHPLFLGGVGFGHLGGLTRDRGNGQAR
jgi:hypothetical protein